jgi:hypothetical protein
MEPVFRRQERIAVAICGVVIKMMKGPVEGEIPMSAFIGAVCLAVVVIYLGLSRTKGTKDF